MRFVRSGSSYLSQEDMRQHFGLGPRTQADSVEVRWPDDTVTRLENVKANQRPDDRAPVTSWPAAKPPVRPGAADRIPCRLLQPAVAC